MGSLETLDISCADAYKHVKKLEREDDTYAGKHKKVGKKEREESRMKLILANRNLGVGLGISTDPKSRELGPEYGPALRDYHDRKKKDLQVKKRKNFYPTQ